MLLQKVPLTFSMAPVKSPESRNLETAIPEGCLAFLPGDTLSLTCELILQYCDKVNSNTLNTFWGRGKKCKHRTEIKEYKGTCVTYLPISKN